MKDFKIYRSHFLRKEDCKLHDTTALYSDNVFYFLEGEFIEITFHESNHEYLLQFYFNNVYGNVYGRETYGGFMKHLEQREIYPIR